MTIPLILTHGNLADELLAAAHEIAGDQLPRFESLTLEWSDSFEAARVKVAAKLEQVDAGAGVLILADMFGGTPYNVALEFFRPDRVEIVTGVNLPMVLRLGCSGGLERSPAELAEWIQSKGRRSICTAAEARESCAPAPSAQKGGGGR